MKSTHIYPMALLLVATVLFSCGGTDTKKGVIRGQLVLQGQADNSGITVLLYPGGLLSESVTDILGQHSQLAFDVTDRHLFEHRATDPFKVTQTSSNGTFSFPKVDYGLYNVAYFKEGYGVQYVTDIELNTADLDLANGRPIYTLKPVIAVPALIVGPFTFLSGQCYLLEQNAIATETSSITFENGSGLFIEPNVKLSVYGSVTGPPDGGYAFISSSDDLYSSQASSIQQGIGMEILSPAQNIQNLVFSSLATGLAVRGAQSSVASSSFIYCGTGFTSYQADGLDIGHCVFYHNMGDASAGMYNNSANNITIHDCLFYTNSIAAQNDVVINGSVTNNAFIDNSRAYLNLWESTAVFSHNLISSQGVGVENSGKSNLTIEYNDFNTRICVKTYHTNNWFNSVNNGWTKASYNNFVATQYAVESKAMYYYAEDAFPLDFKQNYWNTSSTGSIPAMIIDTNDLGAHGGSWVWSRVDYIPIRMGAVATAGITQ